MADTAQYVDVEVGTQGPFPPGPRLPVAVQLAAYGVQPWPFFDWCSRHHGDPFTVRMFGAPTVHFATPEAVQQIFALRNDEFVLSAALERTLADFVGPRSILLLAGHEHRRDRKLLTHAFHTTPFAEHEATMQAVTERHLASWPRDEVFVTHPAMQELTLEVMLRAAFGVTDPGALDALLPPLRTFLATGSSLRLLLAIVQRGRFDKRAYERFIAIRAAVHDSVDALIRQRRTDPDLMTRRDILSMLLTAQDENGDWLADVEVRDELMTMLLAGHDTTASTLAWACDLLAHSPYAATRLADELRTNDDALLDATIKEVMRLRPVASEVGHDVCGPVTIGGWDLPAGTTVVANIYLAHRRADTYPEPLAFRPERFLAGAPDPHAWIPFGGGVRRCLGATFATLELRAVLRMLLQEVTLQPVRHPEQTRRRAVTAIPAHGAPVVLRPR